MTIRNKGLSAAVVGMILAALVLAPVVAEAHRRHTHVADFVHLALDLIGIFVIAPAVSGPPSYTRIDCDVRPEAAEVYVDGRYVGPARDLDGWPSFLWLRPGARTLEFRLPGYRPLRLEIDARPGEHLRLDDVLSPEDSRGAAPPPPPAAAEDESRERRIRSYGYPNEGERAPGSDRQGRQAQEQREMGFLSIRVEPAGAAVYVNGDFVAVAPMDSEALPVPPGSYTVEAVLPGHATARQEVVVAAGRSENVVLLLSPAP